MQSVENQLVTDKVWHELAFGLESLGYKNDIIRRRVAETASFFGIQNWFDKNVSELSGGQKQILNLASIMAMQPQVLILDEPTSQLDPIAASNFLSCIKRINSELSVTIIITEHRLDEILPASSRVLVMENGEIISFDTPKKTGENLKRRNSKTFLSLPAPMQVWNGVEGFSKECPTTVTEGRQALLQYAKNHALTPIFPQKTIKHDKNASVSLKDVWFRYEKDSPDILKELSLKAYAGEFLAILGGNGMGKSTALTVINGINTPYRGSVKIFGEDIKNVARFSSENELLIASLPQNPQTLFVKKTVFEDLKEMLKDRKLNKSDCEERLNKVIRLCKLESLCDRHPYDLSGGEQQRAALAKLLLLRPKILLLDEPTKGLDAEFKGEFAQIIKRLTNANVTVIMVSHDVEFCAKYAHRCMMFFGGEVVSEGLSREFFCSNSFFVTSSCRMAKGIIENAVTAQDIIFSCTGKTPDENSEKSDLKRENDFDSRFKNSEQELKSEKEINKSGTSESIAQIKSQNKKTRLPLWKKLLSAVCTAALIFGLAVNLDYIKAFGLDNFSFWENFAIIAVPVAGLMVCFSSLSKRPIDEPKLNANRKISKRTIASAVMILLLIPITIFVGITYLEDKKYLFISLLVLFECMLPFFLIFEGRKPQARELVIIAVLCAVAVAGRIAFAFVPQFKPIIAIIIISGVAFGGETGFLTGAVSMLVSNIMFQQGPWTPWQMFSAGIIGFIAGILFKKGLLKRNRTALCIFGFIITIVVYGGIMNFASAVMMHAQMNFETLLSYYQAGFPMDLVLALSTVAFLFFGAEPMLEKLDRIKLKYGIIS